MEKHRDIEDIPRITESVWKIPYWKNGGALNGDDLPSAVFHRIQSW